MEEHDKRHEARLRGCLKRRGYYLRKDRTRSWSYDCQGGYMIVDPYHNAIIAGERFDLTLADVENWLERFVWRVA